MKLHLNLIYLHIYWTMRKMSYHIRKLEVAHMRKDKKATSRSIKTFVQNFIAKLSYSLQYHLKLNWVSLIIILHSRPPGIVVK